MSKNKNLILLKDYVNEHILLEQIGQLYGCSEGYGYNPFTKECYPIPSDMDPANYKSLAPPKVVKRKSTTGGGTGLPGKDDAKEVLVNVKRLAETPIESSKACLDQHPIASWLGVYTGMGAPGLRPLLRGTGRTLMALTPGGLKGAAILGIAALGTLSYLGYKWLASKINSIGTDLASDPTSAFSKVASAKEYIDSHIKNIESIEKQAEMIFSPDNPQGKATGVTSPSCFLFVMVGTFAIRKTGGAILKPVSVATIRKSNDFLAYAGKTMSTALLRKSRYMGDSASSAYIALKSSNLLPTSAGKIEMIADGSRSILKVSGADDIIKIDASKLSAELQKKLSKRIQDGQLIIDTKQVNKELLDISDDVAKSAQKTMEREASDSIRRGSTISDLKKIQKIMARGGDLSSAALRSRYFSSSSEVLVDLVGKQKSNLIKLHKDALELKKLKPSIDPKKLANAHKDIIAGSTPTSVAKDFGISAEYLRKFKAYSSNQAEVLNKFELVREVMEKDAKFTKFYSSDASSTSLKKWFQTPEGANARTGTQKAVATIKDILPTVEDVWASTGFLKTMKYFAYTAFLGGAIYKGPKLLSGFEKDISLPSLDRSAKVFFEETVAKDYESYLIGSRSDTKINTNKLLEDFQTHYLKTLDKTNNKEVIAAGALKDLVNSSRNNKDVDAHFNRETQRGDWKTLYNDFISFLAGQMSPEEDKEEDKTDMFGNSTSSSGNNHVQNAVQELNSWPKGQSENNPITWEKISNYWIEGSGANERTAEWLKDPSNRKQPWSAAFIQWVLRGDEQFQRVNQMGNSRGYPSKMAHAQYVYGAIGNTTKKEELQDGEWFYIPGNISGAGIKDGALRKAGVNFRNLKYQPQVGDIAITDYSSGTKFHGDVITPSGRIGGNVGNKVSVRKNNKKIFGIVTKNPDALEKYKNFIKNNQKLARAIREVKIMNKLDIKQLVAEILNENSGQGYTQYPYGSSVKEEEEPREDYIEEWKALSVEVIRDESRETAIAIAKILVKDLELFEDVLDLAGQNQSVGTEILTKLKQVKEKA